MPEQTSRPRGRRWLVGCGIAASVLVVILVALIVLPLAFGTARKKANTIGSLSSSPEYEMAQALAGAPSATKAADEAAGAAPEESAPGGGPLMSVAQAAEARREIIYTAEMTVEVDDVDAAVAEVQQAVKASGGWLGGKTAFVSDTGEKTATLTIRVASAKFDAVMEQLRNLGDLRSENTKAEDVTRQMVDLEARLKNLRREEEVVAELFKRQGKITDVLQVEQELSRVRGQIEQIQGELNYLRENVAWSTITLTINTTPTKIEQQLRQWSASYHVLNAWRALVKVVRALITALIYFVIVVGPFIAVALAIVWAIRARRRAATPPS